MAMAFRTLITKPTSFHSILSRFFMSSSASLSVPGLSAIASRSVSSSTLLRLRPLIALSDFRRAPCSVDLRCFSSRPTTSSLNDPSPNWTNRPPKETILLDGCDFEHWLVVMDKPEGEPTRDEIIDGYIKTLAQVLGSEDEARKHIYSVSTKHYFAFGALVSEEVSLKIKELPKVRWVLPDSYLDVRNKDYGGEPFIDGQAVPYDPKYHEEWVRNNSRANERSRRNDRPRNFDRSRNFERRRENMQNRDFQSRGVPNASPPPMGGAPPNAPPPHMGGGPPNAPPPHMGGVPPNAPPPHMGGPPPHASAPHMQSNMGGMPPNASFQNAPPNMQYNAPNAGGMQPNPNMQYNAPNAGGMQPNPNMQYNAPNMQYNNPNMGGMPPRDAGPNGGFSNSMPNGGNMPNRDFQYRDAPNNGGGMPYQNNGPPGPMPNRGYQNNYAAPRNGNMEDLPSGNPYDVRNVSGRDEGY